MAYGVEGVGTPDLDRDLLDKAGDFFLGTGRQIVTAPMLSDQVAQMNRYGFYGDLANAQVAGRNIAGQQQSLADALAARANGQGGPSIAEMQLQQTLAQNQKNAAGALAGVRGLNPAAAQRLLLQQQATMGQQAAGQGALLRAQEQLAAQQEYGNQLAQMRGAESTAYGQAGQLGLGQEKSASELQLDVAKSNQQAEQERQRLQAQADSNYNQQSDKKLSQIGGALSEAGKAIMAAHGGTIPKARIIAAHSAAQKALKAGAFEKYNDRAEEVAYATMMKRAKSGKKLSEGELTKLDNKKNDTVPAMLSPGEAVIPRSVMNSPNPPLAAAKFVEALLAKKNPQQAKKEALKAALKKK